ncbi:MAG: DNA polymerase III subunit gamma/tau [Sphingomonadaceae bacterium]|nr:DNA polymerase III subunit gamma/tau [Sphingomonadaceae bacterium]
MPDSPAFDLGEPPQPAKSGAYRVLARKYRPQTFAQLIGQDAMVQTLANAIKRDRIAHAFLMTGVRGVGKTSTARLIAKALNCIGPDGSGGPTIDPCGQCEPCRAIAEGRHIDVIEIDAASHNGVDDIREISDAVRYASVSARYKVYIIDEVHMLSKPAFNAVLKTLEEPPPHVKFILATTEVAKVPVTVLSRCQRFDLRRIPADKLAAHFAHVAELEKVEAEPEALALIARAAEGSARDGLSILDQAIAHAEAGSGVSAAQVRDMLGLSDRGALRHLLGLLLAGEAGAALAALHDQYDLGVEPAAVFRGLLEATHGITRVKVGAASDPAQSAEEREAYAEWASRLGYATLHRLWQLLLKGLDEVQSSPLAIEAAEMGLLRIIHASQLPDPGELLRRLQSGEALPAPPSQPDDRSSRAQSRDAPQERASAALGTNGGGVEDIPEDFAALIALLEHQREPGLAALLRNRARLVRYAPPALSLRSDRPLPADLAGTLKRATGMAWTVRFDEQGEAQPTLDEQADAAEAAAREDILRAPVVAAAFEAFPDAKLI